MDQSKSKESKTTRNNAGAGAMQIRAERNFNVAQTAKVKVRFESDDGHFEITNISETGFASKSPSSFQPNHVVRIDITTGSGQSIYDGRARVAWRNGDEAGFAFEDRFLAEAFLVHMEVCHMIAENAHRELTNTIQIPDQFRDIIFRFKRYLEKIKIELDAVDESNVKLGGESKAAFDEAMKLVFTSEIIPTLRDFNRRLDNLLRETTDKNLKGKIISVFREELNKYLTVGAFTNRALHKPLGYAGDYEMMNQIYRETLEGLSSFSKLIHLYGITEQSSLSVIERRKMVATKLINLIKIGGETKVLALASGPAKEVLDVINELNTDQLAKCSFFLLDQDIEALLNAKRGINSAFIQNNKKAEVNYLKISVKDILEKQPNAAPLSSIGFDFVYTMGLYDYLTQPVARFLTNELCGWLKPKGRLLIGNFNPQNPTKAISELSVDWRLIHRTDEEMLDLVPKHAVSNHRIYHDSQGIEVFLEIEK